MPIIDFPPVDSANEHGLVAIGGDLHPDSLLLAYYRGIYPWPIDPEYPMAWFSPDPRGVIPTNDYHIPRKLKKELKKGNFSITFNQNFEEVIKECAKVSRKGESGTWITDEVIEGYTNFHKQGHAYSIDVWNENKQLVGGLYGVNIGRYFTGESMFFKETNASKAALIIILENLKRNNIPFLDSQMVTNVTATMGAIEIPREDFIKVIEILAREEKPDNSSFTTDIKEIIN
jgi:leucyl/phenylalanyl-tRNA--protein transferase